METVFEPNLVLARRFGDRELEAWTHVCAAMGHLYVMRGDIAVRHALLAKQICDAAGRFEGFTRTSAEHALRTGLMLWGRMTELGDVAPEHASRARARSNLLSSTAAQIYSALATLAADRPEHALAELSAAYDSWTTGEHWQRWRRTSAGIWPNGAHALFIQTWALIYRGNGASALDNLRRGWSVLGKQRYLKVAAWRSLFLWSRGAAAIAAARETGAPAVLRQARGSLRRLRRTKDFAGATAFAALLEAGLAARSGDCVTARACLSTAATVFDALAMKLFAASARRKLAELDGGEHGMERLREVDAQMRALGVASPERWAAMYVPGLERAND
jgi:hypothetical protein